jgi:adenosine deaminase
MHAERIGHGYRVLQDKSIYEDVIKRGVHFEASPTSSVMTGSIPLDWPNHPIAQ